VIPARGSASVTPGAVKASAGATERVRIAEVGNLMKAIDTLRDSGVRVLGAGAAEGERLDAVDFKLPTAIVVGAEGKGMREAVVRRCDGQFHIPAARHGVVAERVGRRRHRPLRSCPPARRVDRPGRQARALVGRRSRRVVPLIECPARRFKEHACHHAFP
jgi:hypothetical protein